MSQQDRCLRCGRAGHCSASCTRPYAQRGFAQVLLLKVLVAVAVAAGAVVLYQRHAEGLREEGRKEVRAEWAAANLTAEREARARDAEARRIEQHRQSVQADIQQRKDHAIRDLEGRLADSLDELRNRPDRPAGAGGAAGDSQAGAAGTGAGLYRADAEFLTREAARAQRILIQRDACHDAYDALTVKP